MWNVGAIFFSQICQMCAPCVIIYCSDFICGEFMHIHFPYKPISYLEYMAYMTNVVGMLVSSTYLTITCDVFFVVGCVFLHICTHVGPIFPFSILLYDVHLKMWQSYLFSDKCQICA